MQQSRLRTLVEQHFDLRQQLQELEAQRLKLKLQKIENNLAVRAKSRDAVGEVSLHRSANSENCGVFAFCLVRIGSTDIAPGQANTRPRILPDASSAMTDQIGVLVANFFKPFYRDVYVSMMTSELQDDGL